MSKNTSKPAIDLSVEEDDERHPVNLYEELKRICRDSRAIHEPSWAENIDNMTGFLLESAEQALRGKKGSEYSEVGPGATETGLMTVVNRVLPAILRMDARAMGLITGFQGIPASSDDADQDAAEALQKLMQAIWYNDNIFGDVVQALNIAFATSKGYIFVETDRKYETGPKVLHEVVDPLRVYCYPGLRKSLMESPLVAIDQYLTAEDIERRWKAVPGDAEPAEYENNDRIDRLFSEMGKVLFRVSRLFFRPDKNRGWPKGRQFVICGGEVIDQVHDDSGDDWIGVGNPKKPETLEYPLVEFSDVPTGLGYWGRGRQTAARAPQKILNIAWSKVSQVSTMPGLVIGIPYGAALGTEELGGVPVQVVKYNPVAGKGVEFWTPPQMPMYEYAINKAEQWIDEIYSQPPPSRGESPGSRFPASGIQMLVEQAELGDSPFGKMVMDSASRLAKKICIEGQMWWPDEMVEHVLGDNGRWQRVEFKKAELQEGWDIRVIADTGLPQTRQARLQAVQNLAQFQLLGDLQDPKNQRRARKLAQFYTDEDAFDPEKPQTNNAKDEEVKLAKGQDVPIGWYDDDQVHLEHHLMVAVREADKMSPEVSAVRQRHSDSHMARYSGGVAEQKMGPQDEAALMEAQATADQAGQGGAV